MRRLVSFLPLAVLAAACASAPLPKEQLTAPGALVFNGYQNPAVNCFSCHGGAATGGMKGPNLAKRVPDLADDRVAEVIQNGKGFMPGFKGKITDEEQKQIVEWLRQSFPAKQP